MRIRVSFHTFSLTGDECLRLLFKNIDTRIPETKICEELTTLTINVQRVKQLRSRRRDHDQDKDRPITPHFIVSVARSTDVMKVRALNVICGLRIKGETYVVSKGPMQFKRCKRFGQTQQNCIYAPRCVACGDAHPSGSCAIPSSSLRVPAAGA
jgi:hypothetical protein